MEQILENWRRFAEAANRDADGGVVKAKDEDGSLIIKDMAEDDEDEEDEDLDEWKAEDDHKYPSRKQRKRNSKMLKPDRASWNAGYSDLKSLAKGRVGLDSVALQEKKPRKKQCHAYNPFHGNDGQFVNPEKESGSSSMRPPDKDSPDDCTWGQNRRSSANRSTQSTKRPCGRAGKYRCKDGTAKWEESLARLEELAASDLTLEGKKEQFEAYLSGVISRELQRAVQAHMNKSGCSFQQLIQAMTAWANAEKGGAKK